MAETRIISSGKPDPDPTLLTTENLRREIANLKELVEAKFEANDEAEFALKELLLTKIEQLAAVTNERFTGVAAQFAERDTRTDQRAGDTKLAVDAAFAAAKEATAKIEAGFTKSIDGLQDLMNTNTKASDEKIGDLKDRLTTIESRTQGIGFANQDNRSSVGTVIAVISLIVAAGTLFTMVLRTAH